MPAALRCPHCKKAFLIEKSEEDRTFKCRVCGGMVEFRGRPDGDVELPKRERPKQRFNFAELPGWAVGLLSAAILGILTYLVLLGTGQVGEPHDRLYHALKSEYDSLAGIVEDLETSEDVAEAKPELEAHVQEIERLLADPRPFGRGKKAVGAAFLRRYEKAMEGRFEALREAKSAAFDIQGVGSVVSKTLRPIPHSGMDLKRAFD